MTPSVIEKVTIVLVRPKYAENIGSAARAMKNMGLKHLVLVTSDRPDPEKMKRTATHEAAELIETIQYVDNVNDALAPHTFVAGTTARLGKKRGAIITPARLAEKIGTLSENDSVAILFGPEDRGLSNTDLELCDILVNIPTRDFTSINLAQAVMILSYELSKTSATPSHKPRLSNKAELQIMYENLNALLLEIGLHNPENPDLWPGRFRSFFSRFGLRAKEVALVREMITHVKKKKVKGER